MTRSPEMPSRSTAWIGMPPQTLASMARLMPARIARSQISDPHAAMIALLAVTTDFRCSMAESMISDATSVPPTSSATICTSGCVTTSRQSVVRMTSPSAAGSCFRRHRAAAHRDHFQAESELERDLIGIFGQNGERRGPHISQSDNADVHFLHIQIIVTQAAYWNRARDRRTADCPVHERRRAPPLRRSQERS